MSSAAMTNARGAQRSMFSWSMAFVIHPPADVLSLFGVTRLAECEQRDDFIDYLSHDFSPSLLLILCRVMDAASVAAYDASTPHGASSMLPWAREAAAPEPQSSIRSAEQVDFIAAQYETSDAEFRQCFHTVDHESDPQVLVSEQLLDYISNRLL
jgi:hypothetical protein